MCVFLGRHLIGLEVGVLLLLSAEILLNCSAYKSLTFFLNLFIAILAETHIFEGLKYNDPTSN
jgi:hypothetical protein